MDLPLALTAHDAAFVYLAVAVLGVLMVVNRRLIERLHQRSPLILGGAESSLPRFLAGAAAAMGLIFVFVGFLGFLVKL